MVNLTQFQRDGITLIFDDKGEAFYPGYKSLARVCSMGNSENYTYDTQVKRAIQSEVNKRKQIREARGFWENQDLYPAYPEPFTAEVQTLGGVQSVTLIPRVLGTIAIKRFNPDLYEAMAEAGHLVFLHRLAGYTVREIEPEPVEPPKPALPPTESTAIKPISKRAQKRAKQAQSDAPDVRLATFISNIEKLGLDLKNPHVQAIANQILGIE